MVDIEAAPERAIWRPGMDRFHPGGPEDPDNVIVEFAAERLERHCQVGHPWAERAGWAKLAG